MTGKKEAPQGLPPKQLRTECDPKSLGFATTAELRAEREFVGQDRAIGAIELSAHISHKDYNLYVLGSQGTGRHTAVTRLLSEAAAHRPAPFDWVYVNNFDAPDKPQAMKLEPGTATILKSAMQQVVDDLANEIPALFDSEEFQMQRRAIEEELGQKREEPIAEFAERAEAANVALLRTPMGFMLSAIVDGKPIKPEIYEALPPDQQEEIDAKIEDLQNQLSDILSQAPEFEKEHRQRIQALLAGLAERAVSNRIRGVADRFKGNADVAAYLERVRTDMITNAELFLPSPGRSGKGPFPDVIRKFHLEPQFDRYAVNIMVSHDPDAPLAPVVKEDLPSLPHLTGRIEYISEMGTLSTNFTLIKAGALHRANGGYLMLDAHRILAEPFAWDSLKRCLQNRAISITSLAERYSLSSTVTLEPDPIPLDVRVVLIGDRRLHMLLQLLDPEFSQLFKVQADFDDALPRTARNMRALARVVAAYAIKDGIRPLSATAVAALLDHAVRLAQDAKKFTLELGALADVMREADFYAGKEGRDLISDADIETAIDQARLRAARIEERIQEAVARGTIRINTQGAAVGQINGLSVVGIGTTSFGRASRITARVRMGAGKLIDIEREVELGGPLHSKGVLILAGYLAARYALDVPMSLHASLVFEQSYGGVDGDSASSTELFALLSALADAPIRQGLAVTGSVSQTGEVQAIGGVNEKIEGFFDTCVAQGLDGSQGVLIPASNVEHLMLKKQVVDAVAEGQFRVIPIKDIDSGIEILTGIRAGRRGRSGAFPTDSINGRVEAQLRQFAETRRSFGVQSIAASAKDAT
ncbi:Lon protease family protein [Aestuariivita boseongensis]|uniref:Lon protease family protein n=1 Tax=Aestuariivita boseongensis TaxID=1470562 RepID=UPI000ABA5F32|nr:ATP-binding protein [Aestuariivita boseongensis]